MAAHLSAPFVMAWDDHEVDNDYAGDRDERDTPPEVFLLRRAAAYQAYYESMPLRASLIPNGPNLLLYRQLQFGNLIDMTRARYAAISIEAGGVRRSGRVPGAARCAAHDPRRGTGDSGCSRTSRSHGAQWTVIGQQVPTFARDMASVNPAARYSVDKWDGYAESRNRLFAHIRDAKAPEPDRAVRRRARALVRRSQGRLHQSLLADDRRRVHEFVGHVRR